MVAPFERHSGKNDLVEVIEALTRLRKFFATTEVEWRGNRRTWLDHITMNGSRGYADEEILVQPLVLPAFAKEFLGFDVGLNLAAETSGHGVRPDFTPADRLTHHFVFEAKGSSEGTQLTGHEEQVSNYLRHGTTSEVVLINVVGVVVYARSTSGSLIQTMRIDLRRIASLEPSVAAMFSDAQEFVRFIERFRHRDLSTAEKIARIRDAPPWTPELENTDPEWLRARIQSVVDIVQADVSQQIRHSKLSDPAVLTDDERVSITDELRQLAVRLQVNVETAEGLSISEFMDASPDSSEGKTLRQYEAHVAYWLTTKLVLERIWEDIGLLKPASLYDGGFGDRMAALDERVLDVIAFAFHRAEDHYRALFSHRPTYSWYQPNIDVAIDALYELATTYFGKIESDILGRVYEGTLQKIDRKLLGQYYTPRDVIGLIWDLVMNEDMLAAAGHNGWSLRVLDIATGSGGFLVEGLSRLRKRFQEELTKGATIGRQTWVNMAVEGFNGVEIQRFSSFLAELNLLIQFSQLLRDEPDLRIPELGIVPTDTLSLHSRPTNRLAVTADVATTLVETHFADPSVRLSRAERIKNPEDHDSFFDVVVGNPPYIGEKIGADLWRATRERYPYWDDFVAPHVDYLYPFVILGISKLRPGGRFGFITTEYWLRSIGAAPLRRYLAERCSIERLVLFRDMRLFPDAPGQHSLVVIGERRVDDANVGTVEPSRPRVSVYRGPNLSSNERQAHLNLIRSGSSSKAQGIESFRAGRSPQALGASSWGEVVLTAKEVASRDRIRSLPQLEGLRVVEGVIAAPLRLNAKADETLPRPTLELLGWPDRKAGVFLLNSEEVQALGHLTESERHALRAVINTVDVLPYAAVLDSKGDRLIYLPKPLEIDETTSYADAVAYPFPNGMANLERHLTRLKPLLEVTVNGYNDKRPWWSLHRSRAEIVDALESEGWSDFCVTTRWGNGARLLVGLAPAESVPASGLHALRIAEKSKSAAFLCGLYNSSIFQELAESLPPGQIKAHELLGLGLPDPGPEVWNEVAKRALLQAQRVTEMIQRHDQSFPKLRESLRSDVSLDVLDTSAWLPPAHGGPSWGTIDSVGWIELSEPRGSQAKRITDVELEEDLLGRVLLVAHRDIANESSLRLNLGHDVSDDELSAVRAYLLGLAAIGKHLRDLGGSPVPLNVSTLRDVFNRDVLDLNAVVLDYRQRRGEIDQLLVN